MSMVMHGNCLLGWICVIGNRDRVCQLADGKLPENYHGHSDLILHLNRYYVIFFFT